MLKENLQVIIKINHIMKRTVYLLGFITSFLISSGLLFKIMHWPGANIMLVIGFAFMNIALLPYYFYHKYKAAV
jgi:hypothetical protein